MAGVEDPMSGGPKGDSPPPVKISCPLVHGARRGEFETGGARGEDAGGADAFVTSVGADAAGSKTDPVGSAVEGAGESAWGSPPVLAKMGNCSGSMK